ncbi:TonB-dependent receptor [Coprobacter sp. LH1063]|uniref:TonB-dependent receptor n=1 Tax=Coprobacter tertius TaxID=2944915 RepID=A0ABT1MJD6_9BACT|nr:TonB-dependent receptor plug domain-containing protein [Coprobacter tertius]MCP9612479.1 TonB-dependent receptor [Coprobacter tertius]
MMLCIIYSASFGQTAPDSLKTYQISPVTVTTRNPVRNDIIPAQRLSGIQLEKLNSHTVADAIRFFSGIQIKDYGGIGGLKTVNIRSMGSEHVGVFYDGIEIGNAQNGTVDLGRFSLDNIEAVTLYNGQKSSIFQPAKNFASASSIYLETKTPLFTDNEYYHLKATFKTGSFGTANPSLLWEQKINSDISMSVSTEYLFTTGKYKFRYKVRDGYDTTAVRHNGDVNAFRAETGLFGRIDNGYWKTKVYLYRSERGFPGAVVRGNFTHEERQWDTNVFTQSSFRKNFGKFYSLMLNGKYAYDYLHYLADPQKDPSVMYADNHYKQQEFYLSAANRFSPISWWEFTFSADYLLNKLNADLRDFSTPLRQSGLISFATAFDFGPINIQASLLGTYVHDRVNNNGKAAKDRYKHSPAVVFSYTPFSRADLTFRAFYKDIFRMPTFNELYYVPTLTVSTLKPETVKQYDAGFLYRLSPARVWLRSLEVQADAYYNQINDKIIAVPTNSFFRWSMRNLDKVEIKGIDIVFKTVFQPVRELDLGIKINYTFQKAQDMSDKDRDNYKGQIPYIPMHSGTALFNGSYKSWELNYSFIYTGERYMSSTNTPDNYILPWYTSDLSFSKSLRWNRYRLKITAEINNLLNQQYEVVPNYPMPGTNFRFIFNLTF